MHWSQEPVPDCSTEAREAAGSRVAIYESRFRVEYEGDCRAFYLSEIAPRIDIGEYGLIAIKR